MKLIRFGRGDAANDFEKEIRAGRYAGAYIAIAGTLSPAGNLTRDDVGWLKLSKRGDQIQHITFGKLHQINDHEFGYPYNDPAASETVFGFEAFMPFGKPTRDHPSGENCIHVKNDEQWVLEGAWGSVLKAAATKTYDIALVEDDCPEAYLYELKEFSLPLASSGATPEDIYVPNLAALYVWSTNVTEVDVLVDGREAIDYSVISLQRASALFSRIESGNLDHFKVDLADAGRLVDMASRRVKINLITSAADSITLVSCSAQFSAKRTQDSIQDVDRYIRDKVGAHPEVSVIVSVLGGEKAGDVSRSESGGGRRRVVPVNQPFRGVPV